MRANCKVAASDIPVEAAMALFIAYYNFCRVHGTIKMTPAQASGLTSETWSLEKLLDEAK